MRLLQVTPAFPPSALGGISSHVDLISRELAKQGHTVRVATTNRYDFRNVMSLSGLVEVDGLQVFYAKALWPGRYFFAPGIMAVLRKWVPSVDIVHIHDTRTFVGSVAYRIAKKAHIPYIVTCHGSLSTQIGDTRLKGIHDKIIGRGLVEKAARVIAVSEKELPDLVQFGIPAGRIAVIPNAVPMNRDDRKVPSSPLFAEASGKMILYLGRIHPIKGIDRLVEAFSIARKRLKGCSLVIAGEDFGARSSLEMRVTQLGIDKAVFFVGQKSGPQKEELLRTADVLVLPSHHETLPMVILEAFAHGLPVITTRECGIREQLAASHAALIASSPAEIADGIVQCLEDQSLRQTLRAGGYELLQTRYNWANALTQLNAVYERAVSEDESFKAHAQGRWQHKGMHGN